VTDVAYPTLTKVEGISKILLWDPLITAVLVNFGLNIWPITAIVHVFTDKIFEGLAKVIDMEAIFLVNEAHRKAYDKAKVTLQLIAADKTKGIGSPEFKRARENAKDSLSQFVRFGAAQ
jgi:hypothetical protein